MISDRDVEYIIVQAGGIGSRMNTHSKNKPKCLIPVKGSTILDHLISCYKDKKIIILTQYKSDVLKNYVNFYHSDKNIIFIDCYGKGTADGIQEAVNFIPDDKSFIITWSDLFFQQKQTFNFNSELLVGLSDTFECRWSLIDNKFVNITEKKYGVAGFFVFKNKNKFINIDSNLSFVRGFLSSEFTKKDIDCFYLNNCLEIGTEEVFMKTLSNNRYFNEVNIYDEYVEKKSKYKEFDELINNEINWYSYVGNIYKYCPKVISTNPFRVEKINGVHPYLFNGDKKKVLNGFEKSLNSLHSIESIDSSIDDLELMYVEKPLKRVLKVTSFIPMVSKKEFKINGKVCKNLLFDLDNFYSQMKETYTDKYYIIHGDPTFSNSLIDINNKLWLIDPRGVFGDTKIYGAKEYDWAKLYYSVYGNYDSINMKLFNVNIDSEINLNIKSNGYENYSKDILEMSGVSHRLIELLHCSIWLSLTGYVKEDLDAMMYSFYRSCELWTNLQN